MIWYVEKDSIDKVKGGCLEEIIDNINKLVQEGKAIYMNHSRKSNVSIEFGKKLIKEGYETVYLSIE